MGKAYQRNTRANGLQILLMAEARPNVEDGSFSHLGFFTGGFYFRKILSVHVVISTSLGWMTVIWNTFLVADFNCLLLQEV